MINEPASPKPRRGILCPHCGARTRVFKVRRPALGIIKRRRMCLSCRFRFGTVEKPVEN